MAEPITIATSIFGVATAGLKLATALYDLKATYESAEESIESIASDLNFFAIVLEELGNILNVPASQNIGSQRLIESINQIMEKCKLLFKEVNRMIQKANGSKLSRFGQGVGWIFREGRVRKVTATLDSLKSTLGLMLQTLKLRKSQGDSTSKERAILQNLLNTHQRSVKRLQRIEKTDPVLPYPTSPLNTKQPSTLDAPNVNNEATIAMPPLISTILLQAVPIEDVGIPKSIGEDFSQSGKAKDSDNAIRVQEPAERDPDRIKLLLSQWTRPSTLETAGGQSGGRSNTATSEYTPCSEGNRGPQPLPGLDVLEGMDNFSLKLRKSVQTLMENICQKQEKSKAELQQRLEAVQKSCESDRERVTANHDAEMTKFEKQLLEKENKENTTRSIQLEIERSYLEFETRVRERPATAETLQPFLAHIKRLEDRLSTEVGELTELKAVLTEEKQRVREVYDSKIAELESKAKDEKAKLTKESEEELQKMDRDHQDLAEMLAKNAIEISGLRDQWLLLMQTVGQKYIVQEASNAGHGYQDSPDVPLLAPDWLYEDVDDAHSIADEEEVHGEGRDSDKIPVDENVFEMPADEKIPHLPTDTRKEDFVVPAYEVHGSSMEVYRCRRQAWKVPQPFHSGFNTLSYILSLNLERLWFKASRDEYRFFLGSRIEPIYTIELVPEDLRNYQTSTFEWTVLQKVWANNTALRSSGYVYKEDSDGHVWVQKDLNWFQVQQIFDISCAFLDNMLNVASRKVLVKRSEESGEELPNLVSKSRILPRLRKIRESGLHSELHGAFFRPKVSEN